MNLLLARGLFANTLCSSYPISKSDSSAIPAPSTWTTQMVMLWNYKRYANGQLEFRARAFWAKATCRLVGDRQEGVLRAYPLCTILYLSSTSHGDRKDNDGNIIHRIKDVQSLPCVCVWDECVDGYGIVILSRFFQTSF